jgi:2,4-dienoyl-CoA reductase-like NADH-dependent reductase (Old Yellow Enzyme family)
MKKPFDTFTFPSGAIARNRFVLAPMTTYASNDDLTLSDEEEVYYNSRSKDIGIVITAATAISKNAQAFPNQISIRDERYLDSMKRLATTIKKEGALAVIQLHHGGRMNVPGLVVNQDIVSASSIKANREYAAVPRELKISEIYDVIDDFCNATRLAIEAGFDGVELHGANTYLIQQFFSPHSNRRNDEWGGSLQNRLRFPMTLVDKVLSVKEKYAKPDFIIGYRFSPEELEEPGISLDDTLYLVDHLASKNLDYLHVSLGNYRSTSLRNKEDNQFIVEKLVEVINNRVPLIGAGSIDNIEHAKDALQLGYDLLGLGMACLADKDMVKKMQDNKTPSKIIDSNSLLPSKLMKRLENWGKGLEGKGYTLKK